MSGLAHEMEQSLRQQLDPTFVEVLDESWRHEGHADANGAGFGTHFRVRIAASGAESQLIAPERVVKTCPIKAECRGSSSACALLDGTKKAGLWPACALQGQSTAIARAMASICNAEWASFGGQGGHEGLILSLSALDSLGRVARHRVVYDALAEFIDHRGVHALAIEFA